MWVRAWIAFGVSTCAWAQQTNTHVQQNGGQYGWGWQFTPGEPTVGHYFVKLPQAEQSVRYSADNSGYHGALAVNTSDGQHVHTARFALGQRALELNNLETIPQPFHLPEANKSQQHPQGTNRAPVSPLDIFLLQHQYAAPEQELFQVLPTAVPANLFHYNPNPFYYRQPETTPLYNVKQSHPVQNNANNEDYKAANEERSRPLQKEDTNEQDHEVLTSSVVKVFKDHNCSRHDSISDSVAKASVSEEQKPNKIPEVSNYQRNINGKFGQKDLNNRPLSYRGAVHFRVEPPRDNARSERYYYTTLTPPKNRDYNENQGISRLVASTQDLISNEDLLRINHAAEKHVNIQTDDIIKPRPRFSLKGEQTKYQWYQHPRSRITVKAKIGKIVDSDVEHTENNQSKEQILQTSSNEYKFVSPIVVADPNANNFKEQIVNNLVSTMVPYIEDGYEIVSVKNTLEDNPRDTDESYNSNEDSVRVTPRPIGQKYLAPITVALRLLNANDTETLNFVEDHDASDSEFIPERVESPRKEKTVVEVQESIPISITHINDVEMHEYLEEGRSNNKGPFDIAKTLYNKYVEALESNKKIQTNMNDFLNKYGTGKNDNDNINEDSNEQNGSQENLESSENIQSEVQVKPNEDSSNERSELVNYYNDYDNQKIIQPIIIEKEVPVTKFVDRFIEKQVPYPEPYEVVKQVPVDRPVAVPVPYEKIVERPYEVTRFVNNPYPVHHHHPFPVEVKVPYPVEKKVFVDRPVPYPVDRIIEKPVLQAVPVPTPVAVPYEVQVPVEQKVLYPVPIETPVPYPVEVEKPVPVERIVQKEVPVPYPVEKRVPYPVHYETKVPVPYPVEKRVPVTVEKIVEKPVTVTKIVEKPVHVQVPVPQPYAVHVREPYPVDRIVEKKVPYPVPVDRIVEKKVHVKVPYPVQTVVEKIVEKPVVVTKYVDKPYPVEKRVPYPVEKIVEKKVPYPVQVPYEVKVPYPVDRYVEKQPHVKGPYQFDRPAPVNYGYGYGHGQGAQTQNIHQYLRHNDQNQQPSNQNPVLKNIQQMQAQVQFLKERQKQEMQSTHWGNNQYASSYQYINDTSPRLNDNNIRKSLAEYISYMTNAQANQYYGPPPMQNSDDWWEKNKDYTVEVKVRRTDRTPKVTKLRIEYGGFKPPLIPSTEVDLDGVPVKKDDEQS